MVNMQVFIFIDKFKDVNVVVVVFCGMEVFNVYDWSIDLDFIWVKLDCLGGVYLGFFEVLGFVSCKYCDMIERLNMNVIVLSEVIEV